MRVVIIGAGEVGTAVAENLAPNHNVVVIDTDDDRSEQVKYDLDVLTITGDGTSMGTLDDADIGETDLFLACTDDDRANIVACGTAKAMSDPFTIARTKKVEYFRTWEDSDAAFDVDFMVCTDLQAAEDVVRVIELPTAISVDPFVGGLVTMAEFKIDAESPVAGQTIADADRFESLTFVGLFRNSEMKLPDGGSILQPGDQAVVVGSPRSVRTFASDIAPETALTKPEDIVILGGGEVGYHTARLLEEQGYETRLIEEDESRARELAEKLPGSVVINQDTTDVDFLARENVAEADVVVTALKTDEANLFGTVLTRRLGADRVISVVERVDYVMLFTEIGADVTVNPRKVTAKEISRFSYDSIAENIGVLDSDDAEVIELQLTPGSDLTGAQIRELREGFGAPLVIGAITRDRNLVTPRGDTILQAGDNVVAFVETDSVGRLTALA
ncbi:MAG: K+ transport system, NAD-binding component [uncultured archaeon A07HR60]|nr:MAG: K+ transport system, NAD-binding component [uncultured archaeon A07HR60]